MEIPFEVEAKIGFRARNESELTIHPGEILSVFSEEYIGNIKWYICQNKYGETGKVIADRFKILLDRTSFSNDTNSIDDVDVFDDEPEEELPAQFTRSQNLRTLTSKFGSMSSLSSSVASIQIQNEQCTIKYSDSNTMQISDWLTLVEMDMENIREDRLKIQKLRFYLENRALTWYAQDIAKNIKSMNWEECKEKMIIRFSLNKERPIIGAIRRIWKNNDTMENYFEEKMAFLSQVNLPDIDKVALLTEGMPSNSRVRFVGANLTNPSRWLDFASQIETQKLNAARHKQLS